MSRQNLLAKTPFDPSLYAERVNALLARMTVAEKVGQLHLEHVADCGDLTDYNLGDRADENSIVDKVRRGAVGTMLMHGLEAANIVQKIAVEESRLGIPLLFGFDVIHGHKTIFPIPLGEAATWDPDLLAEAEAVAAKEAYADGINWVYAPMIDLCRDPRWGRVAEGAGEDPLLGSLIAQAKVRGLQTLNPDTGYPCETDLLSVTVITDDGALADCLSTSLFIQGRDAVLDILRRQQAGEDIGYSLIIVDETGNIYVSPALTSAVSLVEGKESAYRLAEIPPK